MIKYLPDKIDDIAIALYFLEEVLSPCLSLTMGVSAHSNKKVLIKKDYLLWTRKVFGLFSQSSTKGVGCGQRFL